jgi:hypothetical protein
MLKKCIVIMVMLTLVAGAAFAQITFGGQLQEGMTLFSGNNVNDNDVMSGVSYTGSNFHEAKYSVLFGDGTAGGRLVWTLNGQVCWGWMQWRPNQYFRVKIGADGDGEWGHAQIVGWGFTGEAKNSVSAVNDYNGSLAMKYRHAGLNYGGYDGDTGFHLGLSFWPVEMLRINILFRDMDKGVEASERFAKMQIGMMFTIEEVGVIRFAAVGQGGLRKDAPDGADIGALHLAFYSNQLVQGLAFEAGVQYYLPKLNADDTYENIQAGAGINLTMTDPFNLKIRGGAYFGGQDKGNARTPGAGFGILPSYKLPKMTIFLHAGAGFEFPDGEDAVYNWFVNPYIWVPMGGMRMWIGVQILDQHVVQDGQFGWNIPFGFNFYF